MPGARAELESLLRTRKLDRTLASASPPDPDAFVPTGIAELDGRLGGGLPRGQLSEIVGARSSGRTSLLLQLVAAATARGELVALVDALDMFDVESAVAAGVELERLLWIRGHVAINPGLCHDMNHRAIEHAIRAFALVLQAGNFGVVALDFGEALPRAIGRLPFTTWLRLQRMIEGQPTVGVLVGNDRMARSSAGLTVQLTQRLRPCRAEDMEIRGEASASVRAGGGAPAQVEKSKTAGRIDWDLFDGLNVTARTVRARSTTRDESPVTFSTRAAG